MSIRFSHISLQSFFVIVAFAFLVSCASSPDEVLERIAKETKSTTPQIMDELTTLTNCELLPGRTLKLTYVVKGSYREEDREGMEKAMKLVLIDRLRERKELEFYSANDVRFEHQFFDANQNTVIHIKIEALDYK